MSNPSHAPDGSASTQSPSIARSNTNSSAVRFQPDHPAPPNDVGDASLDSIAASFDIPSVDDGPEVSSDDGQGYDHYKTSYSNSDRRSSSFGIATPSHGFPSSSAYNYKAMISKHGHGFPERADSVRNISALANLVDYRSNYFEDHRVSEEEIKHRIKHLGWSKAAAVCEYYERLNETLDGWREVDEILDSRFPDEVMRRFLQQDQIAAKNNRRHHHHHHHSSAKHKRRNKQPHTNGHRDQPESDGNISDEEETEEEDLRRNKRSIKRSFSAKAIDAFSGLWFGTSSSPRINDDKRDIEQARQSRSRSKTRQTARPKPFDLTSATEEDEDDYNDRARAATRPLISSSPSVADDTRKASPRSDYGATSASTAGQLFDKLRREGRIEQIRRSESQLALASGANSPASASGTQTPQEAVSSSGSKANTIRPSHVEAISEHADLTAKPDSSARHRPSMNRDPSVERYHRPYASQEEERQALLSTVPSRAKEEETSRSVQFAININLLVNILLLAGKGVAVLSSNSVSLIASFVDSALDLLSTIIIFATSKAIAYRSWKTIYKYPVGKQRLEPLGVVIFSVLMIASFVQVFIESVGRLREVLATGSQDSDSAANLPLIGVAFMLATIGIKTVMWLLYRSSKSSGVRAVAQDAENDVVFNIASLIFPILGSRLGWPALDPIGGIVLSIYIIYEWIETLWETVSKLSGAVASATEISKCLYCVVRFNSVNSVSAFELFHSGDNLIVEADIVLPHSISLKESHDLGEIITYCTENITGVERSYIHLDYNPKGQAGHLTQRG